jgi:phosphocarrier protein
VPFIFWIPAFAGTTPGFPIESLGNDEKIIAVAVVRIFRISFCRKAFLMKEKELLIENKLGLHARAAAQIVKTASAYKSKILLAKDGLEVDGKSIMGIMMLAAAQGSSVTVQAHGEDETKAIVGLEQLFRDKFGEKE